MLHWLIVVGIVAQYFLAEAAEEQDGLSPGPFAPGHIHISLGITLLVLALVRVVWRGFEYRPEPPAGMKGYEILMARAAHIALYTLLVVIPLSGWALATIDGQSLTWFNSFDLPQLPIGRLSKDQLEEIHELLFNALLALALLHIAAALKHHFFDRDNVLRSMLPWRGRPSPC